MLGVQRVLDSSVGMDGSEREGFRRAVEENTTCVWGERGKEVKSIAGKGQ